MPNCFMLVSKLDGQPVKLSVVDDMMARAFGKEPDEEVFFRYWYDSVGLSFALGKTMEETKVMFPEQSDIVDWIDANYTIDAWYERRVRD